jgi:Co/Zn/Cd efflux system component
MRPKHDSLLIGIATGVVISVSGYFIAVGANEWISSALDKPFTFKASTVALIAICLNMLSLGYFRRRYMHQSIRGILFLMMGLAIAWFVVYGQDLLNGEL